MKKSNLTKIVLAFSLTSVLFACAPNNASQTNTGTNQNASTADKAKLGSPSNSKLESFSSDNFKLTFKLPADMQIKINSNEMFEASNSAINFQLIPWKDAKLNEEDILTAGFTYLTNIDRNSFKIDPDSSGYIENLGGYNGFFVGGTATQNDSDIYVGILALIDPKTSENYLSYLTLDKIKNTGEDNKNLNVGGDIFASFARK
jgi:hypothetical protein